MKGIFGILLLIYSVIIIYLTGFIIFGDNSIEVIFGPILESLYNINDGQFIAITIIIGPIIVLLAPILGIIISISSIFTLYLGFSLISESIVKKLILYKTTGSIFDKNKKEEKDIEFHEGNPYFIYIIIAIIIGIIAYYIGLNI